MDCGSSNGLTARLIFPLRLGCVRLCLSAKTAVENRFT